MAKKSGIKIVKSKKKGEVFVQVKAKNGNILITSETYKSTASAFKNILAIAKIFSGVADGTGTTSITDQHGKRWMHFSGEWNCID